MSAQCFHMVHVNYRSTTVRHEIIACEGGGRGGGGGLVVSEDDSCPEWYIILRLQLPLVFLSLHPD